MATFDKANASPAHVVLMRRKFGDLYDWEKPLIQETVGPFDPKAFDGFAERLDLLMGVTFEALIEFSNANQRVLSDRSIDDTQGKRDAWNELLEDDINRLRNGAPHWISGGFGRAEFEADFVYWGQMEEFDLHEALLLSVGLEPKHFPSAKLEASRKAMEKKALLEPIEFLVKRHEQFFRKFPSAPYGKRRVGPTFLYDWFTEISMAVHPRFLQVLQSRAGRQSTAAKSLSQNRLAPAKPDKREIDKIAQLFAAMAIDQLGYDPSTSRSPIPKEIADLAAKMGLDVSVDTVRKYLKTGANFIPEGWKPD